MRPVRRRRRDRRGLALPAAIFVLAVVTVFIIGTAFTATRESWASVGALSQRLALEAAEYGAAAVLRDWDVSWNAGMPVGQTVTAGRGLASGANTIARITRTSPTTWWVVSDGTAGGVAVRRHARRTVNALFRLALPEDRIEAAVSALDTVRVSGTGMIIGTDSIEALAACGVTAMPVAGVASTDTTRTCDGGCGSPGGGIVGSPRLVADSGIAARIAAIQSSMTASIVLPAGAVVTPGPLVTAGSCDLAAPLNWGDPRGGPCGNHLPVIRGLGDLTVRGGVGQGVIVADGDVTFDGGAHFAGLVVAGDDVITSGSGATVLGAVLAGDARRGDGDHTTIGTGGTIRRSACRVRRARLASAAPVRVGERWWVEYD